MSLGIVKKAWQKAVNVQQHSIKLRDESGARMISLTFQYTDDYPESAPQVWLENGSNLSKNNLITLEKLIQETCQELIGSEMIYELCLKVVDYLNYLEDNKGSQHDLMVTNEALRAQELDFEAQEQRKIMEQTDHLQQLELKDKIEHEILMKKEGLRKQKEQTKVVASTAKFIPRIASATLIPLGQSTQLAWFGSAYPKFCILETFQLDSAGSDEVIKRISLQLEAAKGIVHQNAPIIYDYQFDKKEMTFSVLVNHYRKISAVEIVKHATFLAKKAISVLQQLVSICEDMGLVEIPGKQNC